MRALFIAPLTLCLLLSCAPSGNGDARPAISHSRLPLNLIHLPPGFKIDIYADDLPNARQMALSPQGILYVGSQHLWKSTNEGQSWTKISPDLTRHDPKTMGASGGPITKDNTGVETFATIFSIAAFSAEVGLSGSAAGGKAPNFIMAAISNRRALVAVRFEPAITSDEPSAKPSGAPRPH